ncbi:hypothetical protein ACFFTM_17810 [Pseudoduganella plicata]|uniref:Lipoprotein n=1 Tax=Pseudoduganella plicata TaxID=321984 RepID=A0A4V1AU36_9BURK|nr:hypothetical protein [Pseudoduganella plicata]QBQ37798.1 hypothetical protein E1742_17675 [Pseudoduganella plicata]GGY93171.1 hypothetical protein GCM10007388_28320 [Pseudoduganella plicata]
MKPKNPPVLALLGVLLACAGCRAVPSTTPQWDDRFGDATRTAFARQVRDPDAALRHSTADGMDGAGAAAVHQRYQKSFAEKPDAAPAFTIGLGSGK